MPSAVFTPAALTDTGYWISTGTFYPSGYTSAACAFGANGGSENSWVRFPGVSIPPGAAITAAYLRFKAWNSNSSLTCYASIRGELAANPAAPSSYADAVGRTRGDAVAWTPTAWTTGSSYNSPDLAAILNVLIGQSGWATGNAVQLYLMNNGSANGSRRVFDAYGYGSGYPELHVTWTEPVTPIPVGTITVTSPNPTIRLARVPVDTVTVSSPDPTIRMAVIPAGVVRVSSPDPTIGVPLLVKTFTARRSIPLALTLTARRAAPGLAVRLTARRSVPGWISRQLVGRRSVPAVLVRRLTAWRSVLDYNPLSLSLTARRLIPGDGSAIRRDVGWSCQFDDGTPLDLVGASLSGDRESCAWSCTLTLPDEAAWLACSPGRRLTLTLAGQPFALLLEARARGVDYGTRTWTATARTVSCLLDAPYAASLSRSWPEVTALAAAEELAGLAGLPLAWEVCNWTLPSGRLTAEAETPAAVLARLASSCGAVLLPDPAGGVVVRYRYPVGVPELGEATPRALLSDDEDVLTLSESYVAAPGYNAVTVADNRAAADNYLAWELDSDRNAGRSTFPPGEGVYLRVYHEAAYAVRATLGRLELVQADIEESAEVVAGFDDTDTADLGKLVLAVDSVTWFGPDLGQLVPAGGSGVLASEGAGFSVAVVAFRTRYDLWKLVAEAVADIYTVQIKLSEVVA